MTNPDRAAAAPSAAQPPSAPPHPGAEGLAPAEQLRAAAARLLCDHRFPIVSQALDKGPCHRCGVPWDGRNLIPKNLREPLATGLEYAATTAAGHRIRPDYPGLPDFRWCLDCQLEECEGLATIDHALAVARAILSPDEPDADKLREARRDAHSARIDYQMAKARADRAIQITLDKDPAQPPTAYVHEDEEQGPSLRCGRCKQPLIWMAQGDTWNELAAALHAHTCPNRQQQEDGTR